MKMRRMTDVDQPDVERFMLNPDSYNYPTQEVEVPAEATASLELVGVLGHEPVGNLGCAIIGRAFLLGDLKHISIDELFTLDEYVDDLPLALAVFMKEAGLLRGDLSRFALTKQTEEIFRFAGFRFHTQDHLDLDGWSIATGLETKRQRGSNPVDA